MTTAITEASRRFHARESLAAWQVLPSLYTVVSKVADVGAAAPRERRDLRPSGRRAHGLGQWCQKSRSAGRARGTRDECAAQPRPQAAAGQPASGLIAKVGDHTAGRPTVAAPARARLGTCIRTAHPRSAAESLWSKRLVALWRATTLPRLPEARKAYNEMPREVKMPF